MFAIILILKLATVSSVQWGRQLQDKRRANTNIFWQVLNVLPLKVLLVPISAQEKSALQIEMDSYPCILQTEDREMAEQLHHT